MMREKDLSFYHEPCSYLPVGQLGVLGRGAAVITFKLVLGVFEEGVQAVA